MDTVRTRKDEREDKARIAILILICILLYLLVRSFGYIEHGEMAIPDTGGVDVFEIACDCCKKDTNEESANGGQTDTESTDKKRAESNPSDQNHADKKYPDKEHDKDESSEEQGEVVVYDDYKIWDNRELRIFANPIYSYANLLAPGSRSDYAFVIRNKNDFDIIIDIIFDEKNDKNINMQYKLEHQGNYLLGTENDYEKIAGVKIENIELPAKSEKEYVLNWEWVDDDYNDTLIGFDATAFYKLNITVASK